MSVKAYKGFNEDMTCRGFQFEEGKEYHEEKAELCHSGFHACENPIDCFKYYSPDHSVYHEVELDEISDEREDDSKICGKHIKIGAKLDIADIVKLAIDYYSNKHIKKSAKADEDCGVSSATGYKGVSSATGAYGVSIATGYKGKAKASIGSAICVCERGEWDGKTYPLLSTKAAIIDGEILKPDTWYTLENGEFVETE